MSSRSRRPDQEPADAEKAWLRFMDHTADTGIIVQASSLLELFARAAWGMFAVITDMDTVRSTQSESFVVTASDREALLVRWLSELNFRHATRHFLFRDFNIQEMGDERLVAEVGGEPVVPERHLIHTEIKAVTFHGLRIGTDRDGWRAEIIFDL